MIKFLLDTNVVFELRKPRPHPAVVVWLRNQQDEQLFLSAVSLGELQAGIELMRRQDLTKAREIESWLDRLEQFYQILPMDTRCLSGMGAIDGPQT